MHTIRKYLRKICHLGARKMDSDTFKGAPMSEIYYEREAFDLDHLPPVANERNHIVLYKLPITVNSSRPPEPYRGESKWDFYHVRMPYDLQCYWKTENTNDPSKKTSQPRWEVIQKALLRDIRNSYELEQAIKSYNQKYAREWKFVSLHALFEEVDETEAEVFFSELLPKIIRLALQLPDIIPCAIPLLKRGKNKSISLSQLQIASLLANAFLCTFPRRNDYKQTSEFASYPSINFSSLFRAHGDQNIEKLRCIVSYFRRVLKKIPTGVVTFTRRSIDETNMPNWSECSMTFDKTLLHVCDDGTIEDDGEGLLQVDFANKYLGGGVLNYGCVQEEIRFVICPELLISRLFTECLDANECMIIMGCERYNAYKGYASSFVWAGDFIDDTPHDRSRRRKCTIVAIDAVPFSDQSHQYREHMLRRELNKAYVGFKHDLPTPAPGVATGNWGCGAFGGDKLLKSLLQLMACCVTKRPLVYYTFGDRDFRDDFFSIYEFLSKNKVTVGELWWCLRRFGGGNHSMHMYAFIMGSLSERRESNSRKKDVSLPQATNRPEANASKKPKRVEAAEKSTKRQSSPIDDSDYNIEDSDNEDDGQFSVNEAMEELNKTTSKYKPPASTGWRTKSSSLTIRNFFPAKSSSTTESQEKRSRPSLVASLENDFNRKCAKIERGTAHNAEKSDSDNGTDSHESTMTANETEECLKNERFETKKAKSKRDFNPFESKKYHCKMDQDVEENESEEPDSDCNAENTVMSPETSKMSEDLFDESMEKTNTEASPDDGERSPSPSKVNARPRSQFNKYQMSHSIEQSSPSGSTVCSALSSEDILTQSESMSNNDQENSDLNTEANKLKALNVTSDK